jgi:pilus assembly protein Flp/PilA
MRLLISPALRHFLRDEGGATAIEYALIAAGIGGAIVVAVTSLGGNVNTMWTKVSTALR